MSWRARVLEAGAWRGVPFLYERVENGIGRRSIVKEFPGRDQPFVEDNGRRARRFTIDMYVVGPDYDVDRDQLRRAFELPGSGKLDHPYWGTLTCTVDGEVRVTETTKEGGMARFTASFVEAGAELPLTVAPDSGLAVVDAVNSTLDAAITAFVDAFDVVDQISDVTDAGLAVINEVTSALNSVRGKIAAALQIIDDTKAAIDALTSVASDTIQTPITLANDLTTLYASVVGGVNKVTDAFDDVVEFFGADGEEAVAAAGSVLSSATRVDVLAKTITELGAVGDDLPTYPETTATEIARMENQRQLVRLGKVATIVEVSRVAADLTFDSFDQAVNVRELTTDLIDSVLSEDTLPDELYSPLTDLRATLVEHLSSAANALPELDDYVPNVTLPALVIAQQLYGDSTRESEILARNPQIRDPSAVPGGQTLKVLSDE